MGMISLKGEPNPRPDYWDDLVSGIKRAFRKRKLVKVLVLGGVDSGKSTLISFLVYRFLKERIGIGFLDLDIGQSTIGLPMTLNSLIASDEDELQVKLERGYPDLWEFVPSDSPRGVVQLFSLGMMNILSLTLRRLESRAMRQPYLMVVDTTGYVSTSEALYLKLMKIRAIRPDAIILIDKPDSSDNERRYLDLIFNYSERLKIYRFRIPRSPYVEPRDRLRRRAYRAGKFKYFFRRTLSLRISPDVLLPFPHPWLSYYPIQEVLMKLKSESFKGILVGIYSRYKFSGIGILRWDGENLLIELNPNSQERDLHLIPSNLVLANDYYTYKLKEVLIPSDETEEESEKRSQ